VGQVTNVQSAVEQPGLGRVAAVVVARLERQVELVDRLEGAAVVAGLLVDKVQAKLARSFRIRLLGERKRHIGWSRM
jgi:hypothetical protein